MFVRCKIGYNIEWPRILQYLIKNRIGKVYRIGFIIIRNPHTQSTSEIARKFGQVVLAQINHK